ncbi:MAG: hypothetical protein H0W81_08360 [Chloroflexi bacterium]|nr:hypothetical protein [Chloroflexota bacterium]
MTRPRLRGPSVADLNVWFVLLVVLLLGAVVRIAPLSSSDYPLNDGGLFARMSSDLAANGFLIPGFTGYNGGAIPFAYPPLGLYLTAGIDTLLGVDPIETLRWLPAAFSAASVLAMYLLAAELLRSRWRGVIAAAAFALMPRSYLWLIVGGGATRALGLFFALLAVRQGVVMLRHLRSRDIVATAILGGLTGLAHPQAAVFLGLSLLTVPAFHIAPGRRVASVVRIALAAVGALLVASPWLLAVVIIHGPAPLLAAGQTGLDLGIGASQLLGLAFADTPVFDLMTALGVLGILVRIARRQWMIPVWLVLTILIDPRAGMTYATVPLALSVVPILGELIARMAPAHGATATLEAATVPVVLRRHPALAILAVLLLFVSLRTAARTAVAETSPLHGLQPDHVAAMGWVRDNTGAEATFSVVTGGSWERDYLSEWFPVLARRTSVATVQGSEWRGFSAFLRRLAIYRQLQECGLGTAACLGEWAKGWELPQSYVFLPKASLFGPSSPTDCCPALRETLMISAQYRVIYDGPGATIFAPTD